MVSGHVDTTAPIVAWIASMSQFVCRLPCPQSCRLLSPRKGSIAVHGVSLTINRLVDEGRSSGRDRCEHQPGFPTPGSPPALSQKKVGDLVNLEVDPMARQVARILERLHGLGDRRA